MTTALIYDSRKPTLSFVFLIFIKCLEHIHFTKMTYKPYAAHIGTSSCSLLTSGDVLRRLANRNLLHPRRKTQCTDRICEIRFVGAYTAQ